MHIHKKKAEQCEVVYEVRQHSHYGKNDSYGNSNVHGDVNETWGNVHIVHGSMENG